MLKIFVALSMLACSVIARHMSRAIPAAPQLNAVPQAVNSKVIRREGNDDAIFAEAEYEFNKAFPLAKNSTVEVIDEVVKGYNYTNDVISEFNKAFESDGKFKTRDGIHYDVIRRLSDKFGGFWGGLEGLSERPNHIYIGQDLDKSHEPDHYQSVMHRGSVVLYVYRIKMKKPIHKVIEAIDERKAIAGALKLNGVPQVNNSIVKDNQENEYNKEFSLAKTSPVVVLEDFLDGNNYTDYVINEFNKVFTSDKIKTRDGIHYDVIRRLGDKLGGFWGGFVALSDKPRQFYIGMDADKSMRKPDHYHIIMHKGSLVLYVYYLKI